MVVFSSAIYMYVLCLLYMYSIIICIYMYGNGYVEVVLYMVEWNPHWDGSLILSVIERLSPFRDKMYCHYNTHVD